MATQDLIHGMNFLSDLGALPMGTVIGINDYFVVDGYVRVAREWQRGNLSNLAAVFPVIELRTDNLVGTDGHLNRINLHAVFSDELSPEVIIGQFVNGLSPSFHLDPTAPATASWSGVPTKQSLTEFGAKIRATIPEDRLAEYSESDLELGFNNLVVPISDVRRLLKGPSFDDRALLAVGRAEWESMRWTPQSIALKKSIINGCDLVFVAAESIDGYGQALTKLQQAGVNSRLIDCSDAHYLSTSSQKDRIGNCFTWICADPTFRGLLHAVTEFDTRVFIGVEPTKLSAQRERPGLHIARVRVSPRTNADLNQAGRFFDVELDLNPGFVAEIGNKGMGKSALLDVVGTVAASRNEPDFTFLSAERFRNPQANRAQWYEGSLEWRDREVTTHGLDERHQPETPERVTYLPQKLIDTICSADPGPARERFASELAAVLFAHVPLPDRLGSNSLFDLITRRSYAIQQRLDVLRADISSQNRQIVEMEQRLKPQHRKEVEGELALLRARLAALEATRPPEPGPSPRYDSPEFKQRTEKIAELKQQIQTVDSEIENSRKGQARVVAELAEIAEIEEAAQTVLRQLQAFSKVYAPRLAALGVSLEDVIDVKANNAALDGLRIGRRSILEQLEARLDPKVQGSLASRRDDLTVEIQELEDQLDRPSREHQVRVKQHDEWVYAQQSIEVGTDTTPGILQKEAELNQLDELPESLLEAQADREGVVREIHATLRQLVSIYEELYRPARSFIDGHPLASAAKLEFGVSLVERGLLERFFAIHRRDVVSSFQGVEEGTASLQDDLASVNFDDVESTLAFVKLIDTSLHELNGSKDKRVLDPERAIRRGHQLEELYDLIFGLSYLVPRYTLQYSGTPIDKLSPGEKGTLLLMFYLLIDPAHHPLLLDQPDENLDNQTIKELLVPAIKEACQRRQVILITHNPNVAVVADADQVIVARFERDEFHYTTGSLESPAINRAVVDILAGTWPAFMNREEKYVPQSS